MSESKGESDDPIAVKAGGSYLPTSSCRDGRLIREVPIAHKEGGWDYLSVDTSARRLYLAQAGRVVAVDIDQDIIVGEVTDTPGVHGFAVASDLGRGFSSNGKESKISVVDLLTLKTLSKTPAGENPDAILYDPGLGFWQEV